MSDHYCVYFDHRYAALGLAMLRSLRAHGGSGTAWVLCLSEEAEAVVATFDIEDLRIVPLRAVEAHFPRLEASKNNRSTIEYYFTLTPHIIRYVFDHASDAHRVAYLDSDLFFFGAVAEMWNAAGQAPVAIIPHNFHPGAKHLARFGDYNVGWVSFTRSGQGLACLDFWAESCAEWCRDVPDGDRFADQGYLGRFHKFAVDLAVVRHKGCNLGPWNIGNYRIHLDDTRVMVDEDPLIFFHFAGFKRGWGRYWFNSHRTYRTHTSNLVRDHVYRPYLAARVSAGSYIVAHTPDWGRETKLRRARGKGIAARAWAVKAIETGFRLLDMITGRALREVEGHDANAPNRPSPPRTRSETAG
jgi:hypothetical protein